MTQKNVVVSETKNGINGSGTITVAQKPPAAPGGYIPIPRRRILKNLEINGGQRINTWIDSMRASSPTHVKSSPSLAEEYNSWIVSTITLFSLLYISLKTYKFFKQTVDLTFFYHSKILVHSHMYRVIIYTCCFFIEQLRHPSALDMFEQIMDAAKGKQIVMFLDYDGTLSPIVDDPDRAFMSDSVSLCLLNSFIYKSVNLVF